ncbi:MAG: BREX-3 system phosphatase PglZ, partial [Spirochaetaceae bacterium]|nr:BREX-3 system phosphatase PglZ [Spirochaetaceae bacterium]
MNGPHESTGTAAGWREETLREFTPGGARLTVVDDPDGLLAEAGIVEALRARGFEVVSLDDRIAFRFFYESRYRSRRDRGDLPDVVAVFTMGEAQEHAVPYDLWQAGRKLSFSLGGLFPKLSWPVVNGLDRSDLETLYAAQVQEPPARPVGESRTRRFVLRHVFGIAPESVKQASDLLRLLLRLHYRRLRLPCHLERHLIGMLRRKPLFRPWPLAQIVPERDAFFAFLQERWPIFLDRLTSGPAAVRETRPGWAPAFSGPAELPFDHHDVRVYVDNLFLEGALRPVAHP